MASLSEQFKAFGLAEAVEHDIEWSTLYDFQQRIRKESGLSANALLDRMKVPRTMQQYLYSQLPPPSTKPSSLGHELRKKLRELSQELEEGKLNPPNEQERASPQERLDFWVRDHRKMLDEAGILGLFVYPHNKLLVAMDDHLSMTWDDTYVTDFLTKALDREFTEGGIEIGRFSYANTSPLGVAPTIADCWGTATVVRLPIGTVGLTATHVLVPVEVPGALEKVGDIRGHAAVGTDERSMTWTPLPDNFGIFRREWVMPHDDIALFQLRSHDHFQPNHIWPFGKFPSSSMKVE